MNQIKKLNDLQNIDNELRDARNTINKIDIQLADDEAITTLKKEISSINERLSDNRKNKKDIELETDELRNHISQINTKLYGGKVNNPKELMDLEKDSKALKLRMQEKEDELLELMDKEENLSKQLSGASQSLKERENEQKIEKENLLSQKSEQESIINNLCSLRNDRITDLDPELLKVYDRVNSKKGNAVVKVEQGRCQGCRIALSMNELQRARGGSLVQCSSCGMGMILYIE